MNHKMVDLKSKFNYIKDNYMIRRSNEQKEKFRKYIQSEFKTMGYNLIVDDKTSSNKNLVTDNKNFKMVVMAHYDTPNKTNLLDLINIARRLNIFGRVFPKLNRALNRITLATVIGLTAYIIKKNFNESILYTYISVLMMILLIGVIQVLFFQNKNNFNDNTSGILALLLLAYKLKNTKLKEDILFLFLDNEEKGCKGSKEIYKSGKYNFKNKPVINLDCIGSGDTLIISYNKKSDLVDKFISDLKYKLEIDFLNIGIKSLSLKKFMKSDYINFKESNAISLGIYKKYPFNYILSNIHTNRDINIDFGYIELISNEIYSVINKGLLAHK